MKYFNKDLAINEEIIFPLIDGRITIFVSHSVSVSLIIYVRAQIDVVRSTYTKHSLRDDFFLMGEGREAGRHDPTDNVIRANCVAHKQLSCYRKFIIRTSFCRFNKSCSFFMPI